MDSPSLQRMGEVHCLLLRWP